MKTNEGCPKRQPSLVKLLNKSARENRVLEPKPFRGRQYVSFELFC